MTARRTGNAWLFGAMAAILLAAIAWWLAGPNGARDERSTDELHQQHGARLKALEEGLAEVTAQLARLESVPGHSPDAASAMQRRIEEEHKGPEAMAAERERQFALMDAEFASERVDPQWAPGAEQKLHAVGLTEAILSIEPAPPRERRIQCRARSCRMEFSFDDEGDATDWALAYVTGIGASLSQVQYDVKRQPDGSARVVMFGAR